MSADTEVDLSTQQLVAARRQVAAARQAIENGNLLNAHDALAVADLYLSGREAP